MTWNRKRTAALAAGLLAASMTIGFGVASAVSNSADSDAPSYPTTPDGRSIGTLPTDDKPLSVDDMPDLIQVQGDHGKLGYVTKHDFMGGPAPSSPEEALAQQEQSKTTTIPVYDEDGKTVIDTFTVIGHDGDGVILESEKDNR